MEHWTEELLELMIEKLIDRKKIQDGAAYDSSNRSESAQISDTALFAQLGNKIEVVKKHDD